MIFWSAVSQSTFHYNSAYLSDTNSYNAPAWETGFDTQEAKLPTYWNTPFSKICLGMKIGQQIKFVAMSKQASSLHSLIADGQLTPYLTGPRHMDLTDGFICLLTIRM